MGLAMQKSQIENDVYDLFNKIYEAGLIAGYDRGYDDGFEDGYFQRLTEDKPALSDGLRKGSSECGKAMNALKTIGSK